jgi:hypothetical protein
LPKKSKQQDNGHATSAVDNMKARKFYNHIFDLLNDSVNDNCKLIVVDLRQNKMLPMRSVDEPRRSYAQASN